MKIAENDPVRIVSTLIDSLNLTEIKKLYKEYGRSAYHPQMMLKVIIYAYMNNIYSCRKIEKLLRRDIHYIWLSGYEKPDFITINRFRNRVKKEINQVFTQLVLLLAGKGYVSLDVEYIDGTKIESKANKYTFVWRKSVEKNKNKGSNYLETIEERIGNLINKIEQHKSLKGSIKLLYTCTPTNITCFVIDDDVFFFPFLSNPESTNSPTIHCDATIGIGHQILEHFKSIFGNDKITKTRYVNKRK